MDKKTNHNLGEDMHKTVTDKEFRHRIYKESLKISKKKTSKATKWAKTQHTFQRRKNKTGQ